MPAWVGTPSAGKTGHGDLPVPAIEFERRKILAHSSNACTLLHAGFIVFGSA